jgi:hypothetical protein
MFERRASLTCFPPPCKQQADLLLPGFLFFLLRQYYPVPSSHPRPSSYFFPASTPWFLFSSYFPSTTRICSFVSLFNISPQTKAMIPRAVVHLFPIVAALRIKGHSRRGLRSVILGASSRIPSLSLF